MQGGAKKHSGSRMMRTYSEYSTISGGSESDLLSRALNNQASMIHDKVVKKIMELMNVDEKTAKIYKAALYRKVQNNDPQKLLNNYDRAVEMEKLTTKDVLDTVNIEETASEMEKHFKEKEQEKGNDKGKEESAKEKPAKKASAKKTSAKKPKKDVERQKSKKAKKMARVWSATSADDESSSNSEY